MAQIFQSFANSTNKNKNHKAMITGATFDNIFIFQDLNHFKSKELVTTETLLKAIASHANSGLKIRPNFTNIQAATGIHNIL